MTPPHGLCTVAWIDLSYALAYGVGMSTTSAEKGSQLQIQHFVNNEPDRLATAISAQVRALGARRPVFAWQSPLKADDYQEYKDRRFLKAVGAGRLHQALTAFWPDNGPVWDALATFTSDAGPGVLLVEGKAHDGELSSSCKAKDSRSREAIEKALSHTREVLGATGSIDLWMNGYYQAANRLAHLVWLREQGVDAWLVTLLFTDDRSNKPTSEKDMRGAVAEMHGHLGLRVGIPEQAAEVYLEAAELRQS